MDFIDEVLQKAQKAGKFIADKADTAVDYVSLEYKASSLRSKLDSQYKELGRLYYKLSQTQAEDCGELQEISDSIRALYTKFRWQISSRLPAWIFTTTHIRYTPCCL